MSILIYIQRNDMDRKQIIKNQIHENNVSICDIYDEIREHEANIKNLKEEIEFYKQYNKQLEEELKEDEEL